MQWDTRIKGSIATIQRHYGPLPRSLLQMYSILGLPSVCSYQFFRNLCAGEVSQASRVAKEVCEHLEVITVRAATALVTDSAPRNEVANTLTRQLIWLTDVATSEPFEIRLRHKLDQLIFPSRMRVLWIVDDTLMVDMAHVMPYLVRGFFRSRSLRDKGADAHLIILIHSDALASRFQERVWRQNQVYKHVSVMALASFLELLKHIR